MWQERQGQGIHGGGLVARVHRTDRRKSSVDLYWWSGPTCRPSRRLGRREVKAALRVERLPSPDSRILSGSYRPT